MIFSKSACLPIYCYTPSENWDRELQNGVQHVSGTFFGRNEGITYMWPAICLCTIVIPTLMKWNLYYCLMFLCHSVKSVANSYCRQLTLRFVSIHLLLLLEKCRSHEVKHYEKQQCDTYRFQGHETRLSVGCSIHPLLHAVDSPAEVQVGWAEHDILIVFLELDGLHKLMTLNILFLRSFFQS